MTRGRRDGGGGAPAARASRERRAAAPAAARPGLPLLLLFVLAVATLLFYWPVLVGAPFGKAWFWEDFLEQNFPYRFFQASYLREGTFPLWNPFVFGGLPYAADMQAGAFYPPHLVLPLFVGPRGLAPEAYEAMEMLHAVLGGVLMGLLARRLFGGRAAPLFAAIAFAFSSFFVVRMKHGNIVETIAWLPGVLLFLREGLRERQAAAIAIAALVFALSALAGAPQYAFFSLAAAGLLALHETVSAGSRAAAAGALARFALFLALAALVSAVVVLPSAELTREALRQSLTYETASEVSFHPKQLVTLLLPRFFGTTAGGRTSGFFGGTYYAFWELACYVGIATLPLVALGLARPLGRDARFLVILAAAGFLLALGKYGPLHPLLYHALPAYQRFRVPGRFILLAGIGLILLAARGVARLEEGLVDSAAARRRLVRVAALLAVAVASATGVGLAVGPAAAAGARVRDAALALALLGAATAVGLRAAGARASARAAGPLLAALLFADLALFGAGYNLGPIDPIDAVFSKRSIVDFLSKSIGGEPYRVGIRCPEGILILRNAGSLLRIGTIDGYNQLRLRRSHEMLSRGETNPSRFLSLWSVLYQTRPGTERGSLALARNPDALPRARLVHRARVHADDEQILTMLASSLWKPQEATLLESGEAESWPVPEGERAPRIASFAPDEVVVELDALAPGYVVLADPFYPGWEATVDGRPAPIVRADYALRAVRVDTGAKRVVFRFRPASVRVGLLLSLAGLAAAVALVARPRSGTRALLADLLRP